MSRERGWNAINCNPVDRVPRMEFSANQHWPLIEHLTGISLTNATEQQRIQASERFIKEWDYDLFWYAHSCVSTNRNKKTWFPDHGGPDYLQKLKPHARRTRMGHASYQTDAEGIDDFNPQTHCPFETMEEGLALDPMQEYGEFDIHRLALEFQDAFDELETHLPVTLGTGGIYTTLFSGLIEIYGWEMLLMLMTEPDFDQVIERYFQWSMQQYQAYSLTSIPLVVSHDDLVWTSGPVTSPAWYRAHIFPRIAKLWEPLKAAGKKILFTCDGNMTAFIDDIIDMGADMIITEPMTDFDRIAKSAKGRVACFGSFDTRILLLGTKEDVQTEVKRQLETCKRTPGMFFGTGNHIPQNTPIDNVLWYQETFEQNASF